MKPVWPFLLPLLLALSLVAGTSHAELDEAALNKAGNCPAGCPGSWYLDARRVGSWSALDQLRRMRNLMKSATPAARRAAGAGR